MKKLLTAFAVVVILLTYALVPKKTIITLPGDLTSFTLTYTGLGIHGSGFFGFMPHRIVASGQGGYDGGLDTLTITPASSDWALCERGEQGQLLTFGFVTGSVLISRGILVPDLHHRLNASYFYSPDGSTTGTVRDGNGSYDIIRPKFVMHIKVTDGFEKATVSKSPDA